MGVRGEAMLPAVPPWLSIPRKKKEKKS